MHRFRIRLAVGISLGWHALLLVALQLSMSQSGYPTKQLAWQPLNDGDISLCETPVSPESEKTWNLKELVSEPPMMAEPVQHPSLNPTITGSSPPSFQTDSVSKGNNELGQNGPAIGTGQVGKPTTTGQRLHGKVKAGKTIIYVLDSSSSMAEDNQLEHAKACLRESLLTLDESVTFQIIAYNSKAFSHAQEPLRCTEKNRTEAIDWLEKLAPQGSSNHQSGLEAACWRRPHAIFLLTDADDLGPKELTILNKLIPEEVYLNVVIFGELPISGQMEKLTAPRGGTVRQYAQR